MELRVMLFGATANQLDAVEHDRLRQKFGEDVRLWSCDPGSAEEHLNMLDSDRFDAVYVPKAVTSKRPNRLEEIIGGTTEMIEYYAHASIEAAHGVLARIIETPKGITFTEVAL